MCVAGAAACGYVCCRLLHRERCRASLLAAMEETSSMSYLQRRPHGCKKAVQWEVWLVAVYASYACSAGRGTCWDCHLGALSSDVVKHLEQRPLHCITQQGTHVFIYTCIHVCYGSYRLVFALAIAS
jgi:hypothetical protein